MNQKILALATNRVVLLTSQGQSYNFNILIVWSRKLDKWISLIALSYEMKSMLAKAVFGSRKMFFGK